MIDSFINKWLKIFYNSALLFIFMFTNLLIITSLGYIFDITMSVFHLPLSIAISIVEALFLNKDSKKTICSVFIFLVVLVISILLSSHVYDMSYDGNAYHKLAIGLLKDGFNPIYEDVNQFEKKLENVNNSIWVEHYPKATWFYGASVYKLTGNIETAKSYNVWILFVVFFIIAYLINKFFKNKFFAFIMAIVFCFFPIIWEQILTLYVDGFMGYILFLVVLYMALFIKDENNINYKVILGSLLIILINIKFTGLLYGGIFCLGYFIPYLIKKLRIKEFKSLCYNVLIFITIVLCAVLLVGSSSYIKNTFDHSNPLYPLIGKDKIDIMTYLQPESFQKRSALEKNFYSLFSRTANIGMFNNGEPELKIPFTFNGYEITQISCDTRIGGYGVLFGGIFILSLLILLIYFIVEIVHKRYNDLLYLGIPFLIVFLIMFTISDSWWARYSPQLYLIPIMALFVLMKKNSKMIKLFSILLFILLSFNSFLIFRQIVNKYIPPSGKTRMNLNEFKNKELNISLVVENYCGVLYNLKDYNINYHYMNKIEGDVGSLYIGTINYEVIK